MCILKKQNKFLISSRPYPKVFSGFWEFPGGKVNNSELFLEALNREILEELSITINLHEVFHVCSYRVIQKKKKLMLHFFLCLDWVGKVLPNETQQTEWIRIEEIKKFKMLKSNNRIVKHLKNANFFFPH